MPIRLRLARHGRKNTPFYHIVAIPNAKRRDALPIEKLGEYDPTPRIPIHTTPYASTSTSIPPIMPSSIPNTTTKEKKVNWDAERIKWWLDHGAQPSESVVKLLERGGLLNKNSHKWRAWQVKKPKEEKKDA